MKKWVKPELVVLVRHQPEEAVLQNCKTGDGGGPGVSSGYDRCSEGVGTCPTNLPS